jgi:hypothetical protein
MRTAPTTGSFQDSDTPVITVTLQEIRNCEAASWATCDYCGSVLSMLIDGGGKKIKRRRGCNPQHPQSSQFSDHSTRFYDSATYPELPINLILISAMMN